MGDSFDTLETQPTEAPGREFSAQLLERIEEIEQQHDQAADGWHLAQFNLGVFTHPLDAPEMADFVNALDRINELAEGSPGFVWRLKSDDGESSSFVDVPGATDPLVAPNLSVWTDVEPLRQFMYKTDHASYLRRRAEWFQKQDGPLAVVWWIPAGTTPTLEDAVRRLDSLRDNGPTEEAWTFRHSFPKPS